VQGLGELGNLEEDGERENRVEVRPGGLQKKSRKTVDDMAGGKPPLEGRKKTSIQAL
jgi:hypothetical protein